MKDEEKVTCVHNFVDGNICSKCKMPFIVFAGLQCEHNWIMYEWEQYMPSLVIHQGGRTTSSVTESGKYSGKILQLLCTKCLEKKDV